MAFVGGQELLVILIVALLLFGPKKLPELARSFGQAVAEFNKAKNEFSQESFKKLIEEETTVKPEPPGKTKPKPKEKPAK
jgi:sec-independent protein translocase protein TatA